ncbi:hypothetical protein Rsub_12412 [Raphidocelis subcapitata]|uniref:Uncharacterized protein n=1 Tax=Raphidocelis subcapitata TaxID=307507 RepID=A0A2V0PNY6_9CHLO|nr:hypothetical protein Rsub_12412 [Raphidocelis subcapitata]|eukprot:GBF99700.1 hypothetical protein Rsub_12412 [Raphidocelis subcapitata]
MASSPKDQNKGIDPPQSPQAPRRTASLDSQRSSDSGGDPTAPAQPGKGSWPWWARKTGQHRAKDANDPFDNAAAWWSA